MNKYELRQMLQSIVSEEIKKQLPSLLERVLTERYIRNVVVGGNNSLPHQVSKQTPKKIVEGKTGNLSKILMGEDLEEPDSTEDHERIPRPPANDIIDDIYSSNNQKKENKQKRFLDPKLNPLAATGIYEDIVDEEEYIPQVNPNDFSVIAKLSGIEPKKKNQRTNESVSNSREEELKMMEKILEVKRNRLSSIKINPLSPSQLEQPKFSYFNALAEANNSQVPQPESSVVDRQRELSTGFRNLDSLDARIERLLPRKH